MNLSLFCLSWLSLFYLISSKLFKIFECLAMLENNEKDLEKENMKKIVTYGSSVTSIVL